MFRLPCAVLRSGTRVLCSGTWHSSYVLAPPSTQQRNYIINPLQQDPAQGLLNSQRLDPIFKRRGLNHLLHQERTDKLAVLFSKSFQFARSKIMRLQTVPGVVVSGLGALNGMHPIPPPLWQRCGFNGDSVDIKAVGTMEHRQFTEFFINGIDLVG